MPDKLNHAVAVQALHDICAESENLVSSGDLRVAGEARRDYLLASICLQLLSNVEPDTFTNTELAKLPTPEELNAAASSDDNPAPAPAQPVNADQLNQTNEDATIVPGNEATVQDDNTDETADHLSESDLNNDSKPDSGPDDAVLNLDNTVPPPADNTVPPPADNTVPPPADNTVPPPADNSVPATDNTTDATVSQ